MKSTNQTLLSPRCAANSDVLFVSPREVTATQFCLQLYSSCEKIAKKSEEHVLSKVATVSKVVSTSSALSSLCDEFVQLDCDVHENDCGLLGEVEEIDYVVPLNDKFVSKRTMLKEESVLGAKEHNDKLLDNMGLLNEMLAGHDKEISALDEDDEESVYGDEEEELMRIVEEHLFARPQ